MSCKYFHKMMSSLLYFFIITIVVDSIDIPNEIIWVVSRTNQYFSGESQAQACARVGLSPLEMGEYPLQWNYTVFAHVVQSYLGKSISTKAISGIIGCCAPSLWCDDINGCFTQGFGGRFNNYGWLTGSLSNINSVSSKPVYTCIKSNSTLSQISVSTTLANSGILFLKGNNIIPPNYQAADIDTLSIQINNNVCNNVNTVGCRMCGSGSPACPIGSVCLSKNSGSTCYVTCGSSSDESCAFGYVCSGVSIYGTTNPLFICQPNGGNLINSCSASDYARRVDYITCSANNAYYFHASTLSIDYFNLSLTNSNNLGYVKQLSASSLKIGFCNKNSDCYDGNICTLDTCVTNFCIYTSDPTCNSVSQTTRERIAPYVYYSFNAANSVQSVFVNFMLKKGTTSLVSSVDDYPLQTISLPFSVDYFGNLVSQVFLSPNGGIVLPPVGQCDVNMCILFSSIGNVIEPWYCDWNPSLSNFAQVIYYIQSVGDGSNIFGIDANAIHVLYYRMVRYSQKQGQALPEYTFSASIYSDGSIRFSYITIPSAGFLSDDSLGLWGAFISQNQSSFNRYHTEQISHSDVQVGNDIVYCSYNATACIKNSCVSSGETIFANWNGNSQCIALGASLSISCVWAGGVAITPAVLSISDSTSSGYKTLSCTVPSLPFSNGFLTFVDIVISSNAPGVSAASSNFQDVKSIFGILRSSSNEVGRINMLVRYYSNSSSEPQSCGCNALTTGNSICDKNNICGGLGVNSYSDCFGTPFGSAYLDSCGICTMGYSGILPQSTCSSSPSDTESNTFLNLISQTIILLVIICCMTFITSTVSYTIRRLLARRAMQEQMLENDIAIQIIESRRNNVNVRGLSEFECDSLGQVVFTNEFYKAYKKAPSAQINSNKQSSKDIENQVPSESSKIIDFSDKTQNPSVDDSPNSCECTICLMEIQEGNICRVLPAPCGHIFHMTCIDEWFKQSTACPLCKRSMKAILNGSDEEIILAHSVEPNISTSTRNNGRESSNNDSNNSSRNQFNVIGLNNYQRDSSSRGLTRVLILPSNRVQSINGSRQIISSNVEFQPAPQNERQASQQENP